MAPGGRLRAGAPVGWTHGARAGPRPRCSLAAPSPTLELRRSLAALRARIRAWLALAGLARVALAAVLALGAFYLADRGLDLPLALRAFVRLGCLGLQDRLPLPAWMPLVLASAVVAFYLVRGRRAGAPLAGFAFGGLAGLLAALAVRWLAPVGVRLEDAELAAAVEQRRPGLGDRLASALDFEAELAREAAGQGRGESRAMMQALLDEARVTARGASCAQLASGRVPLAWLGTLALALGAAVVAVALDPEQARLFARRSLALEDLPWPRATTLWAVRLEADGRVTRWDPQQPFEVAVGRTLVVHAEAEGEPVEDAQLLDLADGQQPLPRRMFPVTGRTGIYAVELVNVRQGFGFVLQGGDDTDDTPVYRVEATVAPALVDVAADLVFPPYLGREPARVLSGSLEVPQGTQVTLTLVPSEPLASLRVVLGEEAREAERITADGGGEAWRVSLVAERSLRWRAALRSPQGRENDPGQDAYEIVVRPDAAPKVAWAWPRGVTEVTPAGRVPLLVALTDDHAVASATLELRVGADGALQALRLQAMEGEGPVLPRGEPGQRTLAALDGPDGRAGVMAYVPLELGWLGEGAPLPVPSTVQVRVVATDTRGQRAEGAWQVLEVYAPAEVERLLSTRRSGVRSAVAALESEQAARLAQVVELQRGALEAGDLDLLKTVQFAQSKLAQHTDRAVRDYLDVFASFVLDRLGAQNPNERILSMIDRAHRGVAQRGTAALRDDAAFPYALFEEVVAAWRGRTLIDTALLERMLAVLAAALEATQRTAPAAQEAAQQAAQQAGPGAAAGVLAPLEQAQRAHLAALRQLAEALSSWESLNDVIVRLKRIVEEQRALLERLDAEGRAQPGRPAPAPGAR
ncbi:MAG: hypothetical protein ACKOCB_10770 [Planctomycetia bacterium]